MPHNGPGRLMRTEKKQLIAAGWIAYADTSAMICASGATETEAIASAKAIGDDPSGEEYAWLCTAPATARLLAAQGDECAWQLRNGIAELIE